MLRSVVRTHIRPVCLQSRGLVSSVLLTRKYEDKSLVELKKEAKSRGLSQSGSKATLISRIQAEDQQRDRGAFASAHEAGPHLVRGLSSSSPLGAQPTSTSASLQQTMDVRLPDLSQDPPEPPVQVPFVPDFWESSKVKAAEQAKIEEPPLMPKIIITTDESTHHAGGPSHNLYQPSDYAYPVVAEETAPSSMRDGFWGDLADNLALPASFSLQGTSRDVRAVLAESLSDSTSQSSTRQESYSRPLEHEEKQGLWVLLGIVTGAWILGGITKPANKNKAHLPKHSASH